MRRTILLSLFAILALSLANHAYAQRRAGAQFGPARSGFARPGFARGGSAFRHARPISTRGFGYGNAAYGLGYAYLPYDSGDAFPAYDSSAMYAYPPQPAVYAQPPAPPVQPTGHPVITEYNWPAATTATSASQSEPQEFALVLKDGSTLSAISVFASDDGLHYVDPDERHLRLSMSAVDRAATLKLNRERNLNLYLPAAE